MYCGTKAHYYTFLVEGDLTFQGTYLSKRALKSENELVRFITHPDGDRDRDGGRRSNLCN